MTRNDYLIIAAALKRAANREPLDQRTTNTEKLQHKICCIEVANAIACGNPKFDRDRFLKNAGVQS